MPSIPRSIRRRAHTVRRHGMRVAGWLAAATPVLAPILFEG